jgi:hypothetical protein
MCRVHAPITYLLKMPLLHTSCWPNAIICASVLACWADPGFATIITAGGVNQPINVWEHQSWFTG